MPLTHYAQMTHMCCVERKVVAFAEKVLLNYFPLLLSSCAITGFLSYDDTG